jgi:hypothetical protein
MISTVATSGYVLNVSVVGTVAYVADNISLRVIDVSNPGSPLILGSPQIAGGRGIAASASAVCLSGGNPVGIDPPTVLWTLPTQCSAVSAVAEPGDIGRKALLGQAFPNPVYEGSSTIPFTLPSAEKVRVRVLDIAGREVRVLLDRMAGAGAQSVTWNGLDDAGRTVPSGIYFYELGTSDFTATRKLVRLRY